jgi:iron complex transport system permease protein
MGFTRRHMKRLILILVFLSILSIFIGVKDISFWDIFNLSQDQIQVLVLSRIPRLISIVVAGAGLSICGLIMQRITQNRFVSPTTAGTMDSAKLGILISIIIFPGSSTLTKMTTSFIFALAGSFLFLGILRRIKYRNTVIIPLIGLMLGSVLDSITTVIITVGRIPFLGLIIPNLVSMYRGDNLKRSLLSTAILGAVFLLFCDILGRVIIYPYEVPIGLTVGVLGSFIFLFLLARRRSYEG